MRVSFQAITLIILIGTVLVLAVSEVPQLSPSFGSQSYMSKISPALIKQFDEKSQVEVIVIVRDVDGSIPSTDNPVKSVKKLVDKRKVVESGNNVFIAKLAKSELISLAKNKYVYSLAYESEAGSLFLEDAVQIIDADSTWSLPFEGGQHLTGEGQTVCVVDSGIDFNHPDLDQAAEISTTLNCFSANCPPDSSYIDVNGHGTFVAGAIAANGQVVGVAKDADLIGLRVTNATTGLISDVRLWRAIKWCNDHSTQYDISAISISAGTTATFSGVCDSDSTVWSNPMIADIVSQSSSQNIAVVAATGNSGSSSGISSPACLSKVIPVGATTKTDTLWPASNYNSLVKLFAPGADITSTWPEGMWPDGSPGDVADGYWTSSGTSASTPMVSGAIAIMNQYLALTGEPMSMHPKTQIETFLANPENSAPIIGLEGTQWRRINVLKTILAMDSVAPTVNLTDPIDTYIFDETADLLTSNYQFECSATDWSLNQIELELYYEDVSMATGLEPQSLAGDSDTHTFVVPASVFSGYLSEGLDPEVSPAYLEKTFEWNCNATDSNDNSGEAAQDYSFTIKKLFVESA